MREWLVASAVIERDDRLLLVENRRFDGRADWTTPGGVIDAGEEVEHGLAREVREETGLVVHRFGGCLYEITAEAPDLGWLLRVEVHVAVEFDGDLAVGADPDGIVVDAAWVDGAACALHLDNAHPWVREPLLEWVDQRYVDQRSYSYRLLGDRLSSMSVERL